LSPLRRLLMPDEAESRGHSSIGLRVGLPVLVLVAGFVMALLLTGLMSRVARDRAIENIVEEQPAEAVPGNAPGARALAGPPLRFAVAPVLSPESSLLRYQRLADHVAAGMGRHGQLLLQSSYVQTNELLREGRCDLALICTYAFLRARNEFAVRALAVPRVKGKITYHSVIITSADSRATSLLDLEGKRFVTADEMSTTGWLYPAVWLRERARDPGSFFASVRTTGSHDLAVKAVAFGDADCAAVHSLVYEQMPQDVRQRTRVLSQSQEFGMPPVVVPPSASATEVEHLREEFLTLHESVAGREILASLDIERFVVPPPELYRDVEELVRRFEETR